MSRPPNGFASGPGSAMASATRLASPQINNGRPHTPSTGPNVSRAEKFEDEKRRIIESCFSKLDPAGQLAESYITHIRIQEDAQYPSAPPPPDSPHDNKKPRLIIIAVRSTGRVRMHKARENNNGSFSIGKTWNLEDLSAIETFSSPSIQPQSDEEAQNRAWAGTTGFTVTITKPYYWQAGTSKEKDFFIASAVKIFRKYTKGQVPDLRGFEERERAMILGIAPTPQTPGARAESESRHSPAPTQPPFPQRDQARDESRYRQSPGTTAPVTAIPHRLPAESPARPGPDRTLAAPAYERDRSRSRDGDRGDPRLTAPPSRGPPPQAASRFAGVPPRGPSAGAGSPGRNFGQGTLSPQEQIPASLRPHSPARTRDGPTADSRVTERPDMASSPNGSVQQESLLNQSKRQRWGLQPAPSPNEQSVIIPAASTMRSPLAEPASLQSMAPERPGPGSTSQVPTPNSVDPALTDAATINALNNFWAADAQEDRASTLNDVSTPPTPERSRRRPILESQASASTLDLCPAPLNHARRPTEDEATRTTTQRMPNRSVNAFERRPSEDQNTREPAAIVPSAAPTHIAAAARAPPTAPAVQPQSEPATEPAPTPITPAPVDDAVAEEREEEFRPGLGPMYKKKAIADRFKKAANAANAFKPRPGGAAERILRAKAEREGEPDGITGVVPRPAPRQELKEERPVTPDTSILAGNVTARNSPLSPPKLAITSPKSPRPAVVPTESDLRAATPQQDELVARLSPDINVDASPGERAEQRHLRQPQVRIKRRSVQQEKYLVALDIDRSLLEGRGLEFESLLSQFGWSNGILKTEQLHSLEHEIRREQGRIEAGSWLSHSDNSREERVAGVESLLDKAIAECDELEGLLTLYHVELSSLNDDIAYIEAQSQGLQVQSANQKLLQSELQNLVDTMSLDRRSLEPLHRADLTDSRSLDHVEHSLVKLYQALITIDPSIRSNAPGRPRSQGGFGDHETSNMSALRQKKSAYDHETAEFSQRLIQFLTGKFSASMTAAKTHVIRQSGGQGLSKLQPEAFDDVRADLWMYSPVLLFTKEVDTRAWSALMQIYNQRAMPLYRDTFKENLVNWKRAARAPSADDADALFTTQEKEEAPTAIGALNSARKMTVKRSHTIARTLRNTSGEKHGGSEARQAGAMLRAIAFSGALDEMAPLIKREQNFIVDLFHATSLESMDFLDAVNASAPSNRRGTNLSERKPIDPDREMAARVTNSMSEVFGFFMGELSTLIDWTISDDPLQGIGVMAALSRQAYVLQDTNQEYLLQVVESLSAKLQTRFSKFVEEQIRAIEDTKVKIKKRKGVIAFMKTFPLFTSAIENIFLATAKSEHESIDVRRLIDDAYERINRAMFDSLKVIAKDSPGVGAGANRPPHVGDDPEDKEILNYHILLIENMNHYLEEVDDRRVEGVLSEWRNRALRERAEAMDAYVARVIRRPLGKLLDFIESAESILSTTSAQPLVVAARPTFSRKAFRIVLSQYDGKEVRRGIETLRKRIEKHFGDADEEAISRSLVTAVEKECERAFERVIGRAEELIRVCYPNMDGEKPVELEFSRGDVQAGFRR